MATGTVILSCARIQHPSVAAIEYLARLKLGLRRGGRELCLATPSPELAELIDLAGLAGVLGLEVKGQPEERKEPCRVEKEGELADPPV